MQDFRLEQRICELERKNRLLMRGCSAGLVVSCLALVGWANQGVPSEIRAKAFIVVDDKGKEVAGLGINEGGGGHLSMYSGKDVQTVTIESTKDGANALFSTNIESDAGENVVSLGANGKEAYALVGWQNASRVEMTGGTSHAPSLALMQGKKTLFRAPVARK